MRQLPVSLQNVNVAIRWNVITDLAMSRLRPAIMTVAVFPIGRKSFVFMSFITAMVLIRLSIPIPRIGGMTRLAFANRVVVILVFAAIPVGLPVRCVAVAGLIVIVIRLAFVWVVIRFVVSANANVVQRGKSTVTAQITGKRVVCVMFVIAMSVVNAGVIAVSGTSASATVRRIKIMVVRVMRVPVKPVVPVSAFAEIGNC
jgi:hypothetical protein